MATSELIASQVYDPENECWCIHINGIKIWEDEGGGNYPCDILGSAALNHMEAILIDAIEAFMKGNI